VRAAHGWARNGSEFSPREADAPCRIYGHDLEEGALQQMRHACKLPVAVAGALMPDAHQGYGLPIGGVLATDHAVIPYAVGVDIACRMKMTVLDRPVSALETQEDELVQVLERETRFGVGATFRGRREHAVMDEQAWRATPVVAALKDRAWAQLGTSGSGNHFVEFGVLSVTDTSLGLDAGEYLALLSHSGSRGTGNAVAQHYSRVARDCHRALPRELEHLAWLDLDTGEGQEYWAAMELMGRYAAANHQLIHAHVARALGCDVRLDVENHHNFAWRERHLLADGSKRELVVHRKGATPADRGVLGIIPGSMAAPGWVVRGTGDEASLRSASHGAGRRMSRTQARAKFAWSDARPMLRERRVKVLSAGLDEVPMAYKDIADVMAAQRDLVEVLARFDPRLVKMAPAGEAPED
jgi:tRNA-splicing ligase RtcB (3'-phosphate/5'-hydroxy nucleic acid ligase)